MGRKKRLSLPRMTGREYQANLAGLNIFFGAILGVILGGLENLDTVTYALILAVIAGFVVTILYVSASEKRVRYASYAAVALALFWFSFGRGEPPLGLDRDWLNNRLFPTLAVWLLMAIMIEFLPREQEK